MSHVFWAVRMNKSCQIRHSYFGQYLYVSHVASEWMRHVTHGTCMDESCHTVFCHFEQYLYASVCIMTHAVARHECRKVSLYMSHATLCAAARCHLHELGQFWHARV